MKQDIAEIAAGLLANYDAAVRACPANKTFLGDKLCPKCKAGPDEGCREESRAAYSFISNLRPHLLAHSYTEKTDG